MKSTFLLIMAATCIMHANAQLKVKAKCDEFYVDILGGTVNTMRPDYTYGQIKEKMPCFSGTVEEGTAGAKCGATISYADRDVYFFTDRDYIEIKEKFKGKMSMPLFTTMRKGIFKYLGRPALKDDTWEAFQTAYGNIVVYYNKAGKVNKIQMTTKPTSTLQLCE